MEIKEIRLTNFGCYKGAHVVTLPKFGAMIQKNGTGKTTFLNAIRYGLTGTEPDGDIVTKGCDESEVTIVIPKDGTDYEFTRIKNRNKASRFKINGKPTTQKALNGKLAEIVGIPVERIKIVSSSDVVGNMGPDEFGSFLLQYIPEKLKISDIISLIPTATPGMLSIIEENLPEEDIDIDAVDTFNDLCRMTRKDLKADLAAKKLILKEKDVEAPKETETDLRARLDELAKAEAEKSIRAEKKRAYDIAVMARDRYTKQMDDVKKEIDSISASRPDPAALENAKEERNKAQRSVENHRISINGAKSAIMQLTATLAALDKPVCPISPLIVCHEDKAQAKAEIEESIKASEDGIKALEEELKKSEDALLLTDNKIKSLQDEKLLYEKKISLIKQLKTLEDAIPDIPDKPEDIKEIDAETEKFQINQKLKILENIKEASLLKGQIERLETNVKDYDALVKATAEKGEVREGVVKRFLGVFEEVVNDRSKEFRPDVRFSFSAENGVVVRMSPEGTKEFFAYSELSGGERAYLTFMIMDMLNVLSGVNLLFLDELSVMDKEAFASLLDIADKHKAEYDHILIASVDHDDILSAVKARGIPMFS